MSIINRQISFAAFGAVLLTSCASTQHFSPGADKRSPKLDVFLARVQSPQKEHEVIAFIETSGSIFASKNQLMRSFNRKAAELGGDAVADVDFFYIPWVFSSLPAVKGVVIKYR
jgi:hypothetical protein